MSKKLINIIIFLIAGIGCLLALWFSLSFDEKRKDLYYEINTIKGKNPQMITDIKAVTLATLPGFVAAKTDEYKNLAKDLKAKQLQRDIFYTYIVELKDLDEADFAEYQAQFSKRAAVLFAQSERKDNFVKGFNQVKNYASLYPYILSLENEYDVVKQSYLQEKNYERSFANLLKRVSNINDVVSESKKTADLSTLQNDIKSSTKEGSILNVSVSFVYIVFILAIALVVLFSLISVVMSIKSSYQILLWIALLVVVFVVGYFVSSSDLSKSAVAMGHSAGEVKWIGAGVITFYVLFIGSILSILISPFINKFKKI